MTLRRVAAGFTAAVMGASLIAGVALAKPDADDRGKDASAVAVRVGANGRVSVRGASVTAVSTGAVNAASRLGTVPVPWIIQTDASSDVRARGRGAIRITDITIGDAIDFEGMLVGISGGLTVKADTITDLSLENKAVKTTFEGRLKAVASTTPPTTMIITIKGVDRAVNVASDTSIVARLWAKTTLARFSIGDTIRIYGAMSGASIDATVIRNTSIWFP